MDRRLFQIPRVHELVEIEDIAAGEVAEGMDLAEFLQHGERVTVIDLCPRLDVGSLLDILLHERDERSGIVGLVQMAVKSLERERLSIRDRAQDVVCDSLLQAEDGLI